MKKGSNDAILPVASPVPENMQRDTPSQQTSLTKAAPDVAASTGAQCAMLSNSWVRGMFGVFTTQTDAQGAAVRMQSNPEMPTMSVYCNIDWPEMKIFDGHAQNGECINSSALN
jgi:hypothetical protein